MLKLDQDNLNNFRILSQILYLICPLQSFWLMVSNCKEKKEEIYKQTLFEEENWRTAGSNNVDPYFYDLPTKLCCL